MKDRSEIAYFEGHKMKPSHTAADAACFNKPAYSSNCRGIDGENISSRLSSDYKGVQPVQFDLPGNLDFRQRDSCLYYDMSGDKILIIFNHFKYKETRHHRKSLPKTREGTYEDVRNLEKTFQHLGFVVVTHDDWKHKDIMEYLTDVCKKDHRNTSCLAVAVMTHGKGSRLSAADRKYPVSDITETVRSAPSLAGKPKLFFFQACRAGHTEQKLRKKDGVDFSLNEDCLVLYSTYEDHYSFRETEDGSWMMQALCQVLNAHHESLNLIQMITLVNKTVALKVYDKNNPTKQIKQMPVAEYTLKKFLKFKGSISLRHKGGTTK